MVIHQVYRKPTMVGSDDAGLDILEESCIPPCTYIFPLTMSINKY
jgi:hypothetical protein